MGDMGDAGVMGDMGVMSDPDSASMFENAAAATILGNARTSTRARQRIGLYLGGSQPDQLEATAIDFCARGSAVELVPIPAVGHASAPLDAEFSIHTVPAFDAGEPRPRLHLTDAAGVPLSESAVVAAAIRHNHASVDVQVRDSLGSVLAGGKVGTRRSHDLTTQYMRTVAGPLLVMATRHFPLPAPPESAAIPMLTGRATPTDRRWAQVVGTTGFAKRLVERVATAQQWRIARLPGTEPLADLIRDEGRLRAPLKWRAKPGPGFWADPCVVADKRTWVIVEELDMVTCRGAIRLLETVGDDVIPHAILLRTAHHLSFPQVYRTPHGWLATVETCARHNPIYTFDVLGDPWRPAPQLPALPPALADPVLIFDEAGEVSGVLATDAAVDPDSVVVAYALDREAGQWHRLEDAVRVSAINGRGGGTLDPVRGLRATQDCAGAYGRAAEVIAFPEREPAKTLVRVSGRSAGRSADGTRQRGVHTLTWSVDATEMWSDGWHRRPTALGWLWDIKERSHMERCEG